jgi:hypothetical protein
MADAIRQIGVSEVTPIPKDGSLAVAVRALAERALGFFR